jgi:hypothetical protein
MKAVFLLDKNRLLQTSAEPFCCRLLLLLALKKDGESGMELAFKKVVREGWIGPVKERGP